MIAWGDTWQVHNCGSSNWAIGDIFEGPKSTPAGRQVGNEKRQRLAFSHTKQCQLLLVTQTVESRLTVEGSVTDGFKLCFYSSARVQRGCHSPISHKIYKSGKTKGEWQHEVT